jgi:hypothetical protein
VVLHSLDLAGRPEQSRLLSERFGVPVTTIDALLFEGADAEKAQQVENLPSTAGPSEGGAGEEEAAAEAPPEPPAYFDDEISDLLYNKVCAWMWVGGWVRVDGSGWRGGWNALRLIALWCSLLLTPLRPRSHPCPLTPPKPPSPPLHLPHRS